MVEEASGARRRAQENQPVIPVHHRDQPQRRPPHTPQPDSQSHRRAGIELIDVGTHPVAHHHLPAGKRRQERCEAFRGPHVPALVHHHVVSATRHEIPVSSDLLRLARILQAPRVQGEACHFHRSRVISRMLRMRRRHRHVPTTRRQAFRHVPAGLGDSVLVRRVGEGGDEEFRHLTPVA